MLWRNTTGEVALLLMNGLLLTAQTVFGIVPVRMNIVDGCADCNGDGILDFLLRNSGGDTAVGVAR